VPVPGRGCYQVVPGDGVITPIGNRATHAEGIGSSNSEGNWRRQTGRATEEAHRGETRLDRRIEEAGRGADTRSWAIHCPTSVGQDGHDDDRRRRTPQSRLGGVGSPHQAEREVYLPLEAPRQGLEQCDGDQRGDRRTHVPPTQHGSLGIDGLSVQKGIREWMPKWKRNGWRNSMKAGIANTSLWLALDEAIGLHRRV
jgi:hypothetical protein